MGLRISDTYAKIWNIEERGRYAIVELSTSKKNKETDQYETDWSNKFVRFVGNAHTALQGMKGNERIKITSGEVTSTYDKEKRTSYVNYVVFSFELPNGSSSHKSNYDPGAGTSDTDDALPFD